MACTVGCCRLPNSAACREASNTHTVGSSTGCIELGVVHTPGRHTYDALRLRSRLSGNWDMHSMERLSSGTPTGASGSVHASSGGGFGMERMATMPAPTGSSSDFLQRMGKAGSTATFPRDSGGPGLQTGVRDGTSHSESTSALGDSKGTPRGYSRDGFVMIPLDSAFCGGMVAAALQKVACEIEASGKNTGIGILAMLGFDDVTKFLKSQRVSLDGIDWVLCHGGSDIWHAALSADGKSISWEADEHWERHIDWRWERPALARLLTKMAVREEPQRQGSRRLPLLTAMSSMDMSHLEKPGRPSIHPHHILMELDAAAKEVMGSVGAKGSKDGLPSTVIVERLRRRLRCTGYRAHLTLEMLPGDPSLLSRVGITSTPLVSCVHVTPIRASRALGMRFLSTKFGVSLDRFTLLVMAPTATAADDDTLLLVGSNTHDLAELIGGLPHVFVAVPDNPVSAFEDSRLSTSDRATFEKLSVRLSKLMFGERVAWGPTNQGFTKALSTDSTDGEIL